MRMGWWIPAKDMKFIWFLSLTTEIMKPQSSGPLISVVQNSQNSALDRTCLYPMLLPLLESTNSAKSPVGEVTFRLEMGLYMCVPHCRNPFTPKFLLFVITPWYIPFFDVLSLADSPVQLAVGTHQPGMLGAIGFNEENYGCTHIHDRKIKANAHVYIYIYSVCVCVCMYGMVWYGMVWYGMVWYGMYVCMYHVGIEIWVWIKTLVPLWTSKMAGTWMLIPQIWFQRF